MLTAEDLKFITAVFKALRELPYHDLEKMFGSVGVTMLCRLERKLHYMPYCESHGISYEDMTEDDFVDAYLES